LKKEKIVNWHIDHLTTLPFVEITKVFILPDAPKSAECGLVKALQMDFGISTNKKGFGNGDCQICETHLLYSEKPIDQSHFISLYHSTVCLTPSSMEIS
jgi:Uri superfamily endonuclease